MSLLIKSKIEFLNIPKENGVPKVVWCFWAGGEMNETRKLSFDMLLENIGVPICLISNDNLQEFIHSDSPIHSAYPYLSAVHQSDYIRTYLLHHYGGAWHDIKATKVSFDKVWEYFKDENIFLIGKPEVKGGPAKVFDAEGRWMPDHFQELVSAVTWVGKANTPLSKALIENLNSYLDIHFDLLKKFPGKHPREKKIESTFFLKRYITMLTYLLEGRNINYPLPWTVFGNIFHPLNYKFRKNILNTLPTDTVKNAGIYHR